MGKRILVADDSVTIQRAFAMVLGVEDVTLVGARSWDEAVSAARQQRPDLVFADVNLGGRSGYELCAALKADPALARVPVYILASNQIPYEPAKGEQSRADGTFLKPFDSQKLLELVAKAGPAAGVAVSPSAAPAPVPFESTSKVEMGGDGGFEDEDSYGEFVIEATAGGPAPIPTPAPVTLPPAAVQAPRPAAAPQPAAPLRPAAAPPPAAPRPTAAPQSAPAPRPTAAPQSAPAPRPAAAPQVSRPAPTAPPVARPAPAAPSFANPPVSRPASAPSAPRPAAPAGPAPTVAPLWATSSEPTAPRSPPRPSLIPGLMPPQGGGMGAPVTSPAPAAPLDFGRTMMGMPAAVITSNSGARAPAAPQPAKAQRAASNLPATLFDDDVPAAPAPASSLAEMPTPISGKSQAGIGRPLERGSDPVSAKVTASLDNKMAEIAARGPEYEAIAKLSREVIEQVVWEVVPELAEIMIREHIERLAKR